MGPTWGRMGTRMVTPGSTTPTPCRTRRIPRRPTCTTPAITVIQTRWPWRPRACPRRPRGRTIIARCIPSPPAVGAAVETSVSPARPQQQPLPRRPRRPWRPRPLRHRACRSRRCRWSCRSRPLIRPLLLLRPRQRASRSRSSRLSPLPLLPPLQQQMRAMQRTPTTLLTLLQRSPPHPRRASRSMDARSAKTELSSLLWTWLELPLPLLTCALVNQSAFLLPGSLSPCFPLCLSLF